jgi:hypothetical protein
VGGQVWRRLPVIYPESVAADRRQQTYHFDDDGLLRRVDLALDVLDGDHAVQHPSEYREFDGIMVPTGHRMYRRNPDGSPARDSVWIALDLPHVRIS